MNTGLNINLYAVGLFIAGLVCTYHGFRAESARGGRLRFGWIAGPLLCISALIRIGFGISEREESLTWHQVTTSDGVATVIFPGVPEHVESENEINGISVVTETYSYTTKGGDLNLRMTAEISETARAPLEHLALLERQLEENGVELVKQEEIPGERNVYVLHCRMPVKRAAVIMKIAYRERAVYRLIISSPEGQSRVEIIERALASFKVRE